MDAEDFTARAFVPVTKASYRVTHPLDILAALINAFAVALAGRPGPVHVEITRDVLEGNAIELPALLPAPRPAAKPAPD
ncbi:MAG: hypothetical protein C4289_09965, partial [Chloroflexota bacterium]